MQKYFIPDRSNRPKSVEDIGGRVTEAFSNSKLRGEFEDGRPFVLEMVVIDGLPAFYFYFDSSDIKAASVDELKHLVDGVTGKQLPPIRPDVELSYSAKAIKDGQDRDIWEFCIFALCDWEDLFSE